MDETTGPGAWDERDEADATDPPPEQPEQLTLDADADDARLERLSGAPAELDDVLKRLDTAEFEAIGDVSDAGAEEPGTEAEEPEPWPQPQASEPEPEPELETPAEESEPETREPGTSLDVTALPPLEAEVSVRRVTWAAFLPYAALWAMFAAATYLVMQNVPDGTSLVDAREYGFMVAAGLTLVATGPVVALAVWLTARVGVRRDQRTGLWVSALWRVAVIVLAGVAAWWALLMALDAVRLGRL